MQKHTYKAKPEPRGSLVTTAPMNVLVIGHTCGVFIYNQSWSADQRTLGCMPSVYSIKIRDLDE